MTGQRPDGAPTHTARPLLSTVRALIPSMPPSEKRLAESLLADPEAFSTLSINEVADAAGTSTTTVVRFYRRLGFTGFKDLKHDLAQETLRASLLVQSVPATASDIAPDDTLEQIVAKVARDETLSISDTADVLDTGALAQAVTALAQADRIDVFGVGASAVVGIDLQRKLSRIGRTAITWPDAHTAWTAAAVLGPRSVAVAISHSGETMDTVEFLRLARAAGSATVAITNVPDSSITREADVALYTAARETPFRSGALGSRIAQLMVVDCLFIGVVQADYTASVAAIHSTYDAVRSRSLHPR